MRLTTLTRSKTFWTLTLGAALMLGVTVTSASAEPGAPGDGVAKAGKRGGGHGKRGHANRLGLTDAQRLEFKKLRQAKRATMAPLRAQVQIKRAELSALWLAADVDKGAVIRAMSELRTLKAQIDEAKVDFKLGAIQLMTPDQKLKFLERGKRGKRGFKKGFGRRGGKRGFMGKGGKRGKRGERHHGGGGGTNI